MSLQADFAARLVRWQHIHGRHGLPWQLPDPYAVWVSEIMLQQTQVATVLDYYPRFMARFPDVATLAAAAQDEVLALWSGLGYYSRARNLHKAANQVMTQFGGQFPSGRTELETLCGVGRSTAAAIAAFAFGQRETILDGNVKRVLTRVFGIDGFPGDKAVEKQLWLLAESLLPGLATDMKPYTQGLMDLGATVCKRSKPLCTACPMQDGCVARRDGRTAELPQRKPKAAIPEREVVMLLAVHEGKVLLQRRPPSGIWGGLLSLPEFDSTLAVDDWLSEQGEGDLLPAWPVLTHVFTHFRLHITPQCVALQTLAANSVREDNAVWLTLDVAPDAGVPSPVRRLLLAAQAGLQHPTLFD